MNKRLIALVIALLLFAGSALAETALIEKINVEPGFPVVNEPVDVSIMVIPQWGAVDFKPERNWMCQYIDKYSGLNVEWTVVDPSAADERIAMMLNSGDMPDAILGYNFNCDKIVKYGVSDQIFHPINDLLAYCPTLSAYLDANPESRAAITATDGNIYGFPAFSNIWSYDVRFFVQSKWLENLGLEQPDTLEEFKQMLIAFRDQDANGNGDATDEVPWDGAWNEGQSERQFIWSSFGYIGNYDGDIAIDYNGDAPKIVYMPYEASYKDYLEYMNDLWNEGLIAPDMFTQAETQVQATVLEGVVGFCGQSAPYVYDPDHQTEWRSIHPLTTEEGKTPVWPGAKPVFQTATMVLNADLDDETAAALVNLADNMYTLEWYVYATYGPEAGSDLDWNHDGHYFDAEANAIAYNMPEDMTSAWTHRITNLSIWSLPGFNCMGYAPYKIALGQEYPDSAVGQLFKNGDVSRADEVDQQQTYSPYYVSQVPSLFFSAEDMERVTELATPLDDYVASMEAKFITGEASIEKEYDNFIATLEAYGVKEYMDIYTRYFDAYQAN